uniref:discoidin domain-containing protein n=1 Tax=[Lactobacillus] rogosae TaxID=706562 RepID=UPI00402AFDEA
MQQKKTFAILLSLAMIVTIVLGNGTFVSAATTEAITGISYYVDSVNGNDDNDGTSEAKAWKSLEKVNATTFKPGDKLRFKRGCSWSGLLSPKGSGEKGKPITIDAYGDVKDGRPVINGDSWCGDKGDDLENRVFNTAVYFYNQEYWEITSIEVTNHTATKDDHIKKYGILIMGQDAGTLHEINVKNTYVHDVISIPISQQAGIGRGGIVYAIRGNNKATNWEDITVEGNYVKNVNHYGINFISTWGSSTFPDESGITEGGGGTYRSKHLVIRNNYCENIGNAAICPSDYEDALIEYNVSNKCNSGPNGNVPIWWEYGQKTICQYNEVFGSGAADNKEDSQAFDADVCADLNYVQYNYTHDNPSGSFFECSLGTPFETYYRYNISVNDGYGTNLYGGGAVVTLQNPTGGKLDVYNNLIYMDADHDGYITRNWHGSSMASYTASDKFTFTNNVFITEKDNGRAWDENYIGVANNNAYGGANLNNRRDDDANAKVAVKSDYVKLEEGTSATVEDIHGEFKITFGTVDGYRIKDGATVVDQGISVIDNGGQDYYGNEVKSFVKPNIGADNSYNSGVKDDLGEGKILLDFDDCENGALTGIYSNCDFGNRGWNVTDGKLWATSYTNEEQANKLAIPDKYAVTSFEAYCAKGTATVKVEAGEESETFTVTNKKHTFKTNFKKQVPATYIVIKSDDGVDQVKFDNIILSKKTRTTDTETNVSYKKNVTVSSVSGYNPDCVGSNIVDGDDSTIWISSGWSDQGDIVTEERANFIVDLDGSYNIEKLDITFGGDRAESAWKYKVEASTDRTNWDVIWDQTANKEVAATQEVTLDEKITEKKYSYVKVTFGDLVKDARPAVAEFNVY